MVPSNSSLSSLHLICNFSFICWDGNLGLPHRTVAPQEQRWIALCSPSTPVSKYLLNVRHRACTQKPASPCLGVAIRGLRSWTRPVPPRLQHPISYLSAVLPLLLLRNTQPPCENKMDNHLDQFKDDCEGGKSPSSASTDATPAPTFISFIRS